MLVISVAREYEIKLKKLCHIVSVVFHVCEPFQYFPIRQANNIKIFITGW